MPTTDSFPRNGEIGTRIKLRRLQLGLSQESLGLALGVPFEQVQKYESGIDRIGANRLHKIAKILKVPILFFFGGSLEDADAGEDTNAILDFLDTAYSLRLLQAFRRIEDRHVRQSIVELVEMVADKSGAGGS